jgi:hypothetical protein
MAKKTREELRKEYLKAWEATKYYDIKSLKKGAKSSGGKKDIAEDKTEDDKK